MNDKTVGLLIGVAVIGGIAVAGYYVYQQSQKNQLQPVTQQQNNTQLQKKQSDIDKAVGYVNAAADGIDALGNIIARFN